MPQTDENIELETSLSGSPACTHTCSRADMAGKEQAREMTGGKIFNRKGHKVFRKGRKGLLPGHNSGLLFIAEH